MQEMNEDDIFNSVVESAIDFFNSSIENFEDRPKYSLINFCTGIELILKARLIKEHWSLILKNEPKYDQFISGNFISINFKTLLPRIKDVTRVKDIKEAESAFNIIAAHRNKIVHFFHENVKSNASEEAKAQLAREQMHAWWHIQDLIQNQWRSIFTNFIEKISEINQKAQVFRDFLKIKFEKIQPEILKLIADGQTVSECRRCSYKSCLQQSLTNNLHNNKCLVCELEYFDIELECPECHNTLLLDKVIESEFSCPICEYEFKDAEIIEQLDTEEFDRQVGRSSIYCSFCEAEDNVVQHNDYYLCVNCGRVAYSIEQCDWCHQLQICDEDLDNSFLMGCNHIGCEGRLEYKND